MRTCICLWPSSVWHVRGAVYCAQEQCGRQSSSAQKNGEASRLVSAGEHFYASEREEVRGVPQVLNCSRKHKVRTIHGFMETRGWICPSCPCKRRHCSGRRWCSGLHRRVDGHSTFQASQAENDENARKKRGRTDGDWRSEEPQSQRFRQETMWRRMWRNWSPELIVMTQRSSRIRLAHGPVEPRRGVYWSGDELPAADKQRRRYRGVRGLKERREHARAFAVVAPPRENVPNFRLAATATASTYWLGRSWLWWKVKAKRQVLRRDISERKDRARRAEVDSTGTVTTVEPTVTDKLNAGTWT